MIGERVGRREIYTVRCSVSSQPECAQLSSSIISARLPHHEVPARTSLHSRRADRLAQQPDARSFHRSLGPTRTLCCWRQRGCVGPSGGCNDDSVSMLSCDGACSRHIRSSSIQHTTLIPMGPDPRPTEMMCPSSTDSPEIRAKARRFSGLNSPRFLLLPHCNAHGSLIISSYSTCTCFRPTHPTHPLWHSVVRAARAITLSPPYFCLVFGQYANAKVASRFDSFILL